MLEDRDKEFDLKIRSMMEDGREEVPDRVWDAVSGRLSEINAGKHRRTMLIRLRNAGIGVAAAAAVAVAAVFGIRQEPVPETSAIAVVSTAPETQTGIRRGQKLSGGSRNEGKASQVTGQGAASAPEDMAETSRKAAAALIAAAASPAEAPKAEKQSSIPQSVLDTPAETSDKEAEARPDKMAGLSSGNTSDTENISGEETSSRTYSLPDPAAEFAAEFPDDEMKKKRPDVSLAMFGNAISNSASDGNGGAIPPMQSQGRIIRDEIVESHATSYGIPMSFGVGARIGFTPRWTMSIGVNYTLLTRTFDGTYYDNEGTAFTDSDIRNSQHYIGIPVNVYYSICKGSFVDFYAYAGGTVEKCVDDKYLIDATDRIISHHEKSTGVQLSANAGIGVEFTVGNRLGIYIDPSVRYYFESRQPNSIRKVQPLMLGFEAGLRIRL